MATVTIHVEADVVITCSKKAATLYEEENDESELEQHTERLTSAVETALDKVKGFVSHDGVECEVQEVDVEAD